MIRVLHLRSSCGLYGADRVLLDLCGALSPRMHPVVGSIVTGGREDVLGTEAVRRGLRATRIDSGGRADLASVSALSERIAALDIRLLHAHDYKSLCLGVLAGYRTKVPVVATYHGDTAATPALRAYEALARILGNATGGVAAVSAPLARKLRRWVHVAPVRHIPNGVHPGELCSDSARAAARVHFGIAPDAEVLAIVGRLSVEKGHAILFEALRRLTRRVVLLAAGDGGLKEALRGQSEGLDVRWLGFQDDPRPVYAAADAVVMPSLTEGLPLAALEAMAAGRPLIASAVGELPELLADGAGLLVPPGDSAALAGRIGQLLADPSGRARMTARARARVERNYGVETMADRYADELYAPALRGSSRTYSNAWIGSDAAGV